ncbi:MAG TPA: DinB family protein [Acidimicrobiales bacterium]|nr:DinB family protein [Acidimicrobiales bacterium]
MAPPPPGFDASGVSPQDAIVTLRSLKRRFAEAFDRADPPDAVSQPFAGGLSPLDHAAWTATALDQLGAALHQVLVADDPEVRLPPEDPPAGAGGGGGDPAAVLARLGERADALAAAMSEVHGKDWSRTGRGPSGEVTALDIARLAVRLGIDHLRAAETALQGGRG